MKLYVSCSLDLSPLPHARISPPPAWRAPTGTGTYPRIRSAS